MIYYNISLALSLLFTGLYVLKYKKYFDAHVTVIFALIPIVEVAYVLYAKATTVQASLQAVKVIYLGGFYLEFLMTLYIFKVCKINISNLLAVFLFALNSAFYLFVVFSKSTLYYKTVSIRYNGDVSYLDKEYGIMHTFFYILLIAYMLAGCIAIILSVRKNNVPQVLVRYLCLMQIIPIVLYLVSRFVKLEYETAAIQYALVQGILLLASDRTGLYEIDESLLESVIRKGKMGFFSFDIQARFLGANNTAIEFFPELADLGIDKNVLYKTNEFFSVVHGWIEEADMNGQKEFYYEREDKVYRVTQTVIIKGKKVKGHQFFVMDDTEEQKYIALINDYNSELEIKVSEKTAHIQEIQDRLVLGMADMVESRDVSTGGHIKRTSKVIQLFVDEMRRDPSLGIPDSFYQKVVKAAPMHDLGKIAIDDAILRKPEKFSDDEYRIMKEHSQKGAVIVRQVLNGIDDVEFMQIAENIAHYHHERFDGQGYPDGLKGSMIPLEARIMAIVDTYDALVSKRCYKDRMPYSAVFDIIESNMGTQFDPALNKYFVAAKDRIEEFYKNVI
ncbi:MAG: HD domain-containing protein [Lachnospiraceae bacterium]|nr:HD domain-containing protein [Lachnospiraceae bacterium]